MNQGYFKGVQALRGLAALSVMLFHFRWNINESYPGLGQRLFGWGATGVDLFFLISGFVIYLSARNAPATFAGSFNFLKRRALRILPAYYVILVVTFLLSGAMSTFHYEDKTLNFISAWFFQPAYHDHGPFYIDDSGMYGIRWTLNYEVYFYLVVGVLLALPYRWFLTVLWFVITLILLPWCSGESLTLQPTGYNFGPAQVNLITNPIILLFLVGLLLGALTPWLQRLNSRFMTMVLIAVVAFAGYRFSVGLNVDHGLISSGWIYALILLCTIAVEKTIGKWIPGWLIRLGDISFSLYLIHTLMNTGLGKRFEDLGIAPGLLRLTLSIGLSLLLAWLSWRFIEKSTYSLSKKRDDSSEVIITKG